MALVSRAPLITPGVGSVRFHEARTPGITASRRETVEQPVAVVIEDKIYVALDKEVEKSKSTLIWALQNSGGKRICIIHVHLPAQMIPLMGTKFPASSLKPQEVRRYHETERENMEKMLNEYLFICHRMGVRAEKLYTETDSIEKGIIDLISQHSIRKLVMGAAADKQYSKKMMDIKSKKAISIRQHAPASCCIWFVCKGHLIYTREGMEVPSLPVPANPSTDILAHSQSSIIRPNSRVGLTSPAQDLLRRIRSLNLNGHRERARTQLIRSDADHSSDESDLLSRRSPSQVSHFSSFSSSGMDDVTVIQFDRTEEFEDTLELSRSHDLHQSKDDIDHISPPSVLDASIGDDYKQLEQAMSKAGSSRREAFEEALRRGKAEKDAIEAIRRAKASESLYSEELKQRKEIEEALANEKQKLENIKNQEDEVMEALQTALDQKSSLESQLMESDKIVTELEQKIISAVELLQKYKREQEELQVERDSLLKEAEELRKNQAEVSSTPQFFTEFSFSEIEEATNNFAQSLKIGEGGYGSIYKGHLHHTIVAIKMLHSHSLQGPSEFQQEVDVLSKLRHPNLITLIGACPESWALIYEYLSNGSLEDRLRCMDNSSPISWQTRIRIATELCSALIFLHSSEPHSIVHGDLKPANILLDSNLVSKLSDFGICRLLSRHGSINGNTTLFCKTDPKGTFSYMDPEFLSSGELTPKSDVYSFGVILLRLLTGRPALGIIKEVQYALDKGNLKTLLDPLAGDWPFFQAEQLTRLALRCCEINRKTRPDLGTEVFRVLDHMRVSSGGSSSFRLCSEELQQPPSYFICPIFQEVMQDPHVAADGFTYEAEALRGWLDSGHDTSPMTNLKLVHSSLVPNRALRSSIQEWLQQH